MHLLFIGTAIDPISGYGTLTDTHCRAFFDKGVSFTLLLPRSAERVAVPYAKSVRYVLPDLPLSFNSFFGIMRLPLLFWRVPLPRIAFSSVHSLHDFPYAVIGHRIARRRNIPFFFSALGTYSVAPFKRGIDRLLFMPAYRGAERIFAISSFTAKAMQKAAGLKRPIDVVYLPVRESQPPFTAIPLPAALPRNARIILAVGPLKARKGIDILIQAMTDIVQSVPDAHLLIVTAYGNEAPYRLLAEECGVSHRIHFMKGVSSDELYDLFEQADIFALTPRYIRDEFEGYGIVYGEAGWHRLPVVGSLSGGVPEAVVNGVTGFLVPENNARETARAINAILTDNALALRLGTGGYERARSRTASAYADYLIPLYGT